MSLVLIVVMVVMVDKLTSNRREGWVSLVLIVVMVLIVLHRQGIEQKNRCH